MIKSIVIILFLYTIALCGSFCSGFKTGYKEGYCYGKSYCISPISPICPIPHVGERSWTDGYNRGFLRGLKARR